MTITATWLASDADLGVRLFMASDSRLADPDGPLIDEGVKLFQLPIRVFAHGASPARVGAPTFETSVGIVCAGSSLVFQQTYAALVALFSQVQCLGPQLVLPTMGDLASYIARVLGLYYRSLGTNRPASAPVCMVVGGIDPASQTPVAFELLRGLNSDGLYEFVPQKLELAVGAVEFRGDADACQYASDIWHERSKVEQLAATYNSVLNIIESLAEDPTYRTVGGKVQVGYTSPLGFHRVARAAAHGGVAEFYLHGVPLLEIGVIGSNLLPTLPALA